LQDAAVFTGGTKDGIRLEKSVMESSEMSSVRIEMVKETIQDLAKAETIEASAMREAFQKIANELVTMANIIIPEMHKHTLAIREARMAAVRETRETLAAMRSVRDFFLESNYAVEIERMERLVGLCHEIRDLKESGFFDAVCDSALKLAVRGEVAK
jgi:hypothetical protein